MKIDHSGLVDLTHSLLPTIPSWDGDCGFRLDVTTDYKDCPPPDLFRVQNITTRAGMGTHIDAPAHCIEGGKTIDTLTLKDLVAPCVVIKAKGAVTDDYILDAAAILDFEREHGIIQPNSFVIAATGWSRFWNEPEKYRNQLHFPSVDDSAAALLVERNVVGLGIDTLSPDAGGKAFPVHRRILGAGKYLVENVVNAELLPATGSTVFVLPMKVFEGTEAPVRLVALSEPNRA